MPCFALKEKGAGGLLVWEDEHFVEWWFYRKGDGDLLCGWTSCSLSWFLGAETIIEGCRAGLIRARQIRALIALNCWVIKAVNYSLPFYGTSPLSQAHNSRNKHINIYQLFLQWHECLARTRSFMSVQTGVCAYLRLMKRKYLSQNYRPDWDHKWMRS